MDLATPTTLRLQQPSVRPGGLLLSFKKHLPGIYDEVSPNADQRRA